MKGGDKMKQTYEQAVTSIRDYIDRRGGLYNQWYSGVAEDPEKGLFNDHSVDKEKRNC